MEVFNGSGETSPCGKPVIFLLAVGLLILAVAHLALGGNPIRIITEENMISVHAGEHVLLRYRYADVPFKPYAEQLFSPAGVNVLRDAPADHLHHHALMFAVTVDGVNFWEEHQAPGRQVHRSFAQIRVDKRQGIPQASFTEYIDWINPRTQELLLKEHRTIEVYQVKEPKVTLLSWQSGFELPPGRKTATLTGAHYHGLGMRFLKSMDVGGQFRNAAGKTGDIVRGDERLVQSTWCAYTAAANGKPVTVAMFGHPDNLRHPTQWFTMTRAFAYLSATFNLHKQPLKITSDKPLVVRYGVALWDGRIEVGQIDQLYGRWVAWPGKTGRLSNPQEVR